MGEAATKRKAVVQANGLVANVIAIVSGALERRTAILVTDAELAKMEAIEYTIDGMQEAWVVPEGCYLVDAEDSGSPGDIWDGEQFITPEPVPSEPSRLDILEDRIAELEKLE